MTIIINTKLFASILIINMLLLSITGTGIESSSKVTKVYESSGESPIVEGIGFTLPIAKNGWGVVLKFRGDFISGYSLPIAVDETTKILTINPFVYLKPSIFVFFEI